MSGTLYESYERGGHTYYRSVNSADAREYGPVAVTAPQPPPKPFDPSKPKIVDFVVEAFRKRAGEGKLKYGTYLQRFNGRSALRDAKEEAMDQVMYLTQAEEEMDSLLRALKTYGRHLDGCGKRWTEEVADAFGACTCGFEDVFYEAAR